MHSFSDEWKAIKNLDSQRKVAIAILLVILFILGLVIGTLFFARPTQPLVRLPSVNPSPTVTRSRAILSIAPSAKTLKVGETLPVSIVLAGDSAQVVDAVLLFDPTIWQVQTFSVNTDVFPLILRQDSTPGKILVSASVKAQNPPTSVQGEVFKVTFVPQKASPSATIDFDQSTTVAAKGGENILGKVMGGKYVIQ